jgi:hypothetical protein
VVDSNVSDTAANNVELGIDGVSFVVSGAGMEVVAPSVSAIGNVEGVKVEGT